LDPGKLNKRIKIKKKGEKEDGYGGYKTTYIDVCNPWALVRALRGKEKVAAEQTVSEVTHKIIIRYRDDILTSYVVVYKGNILEIESVINLNEENRYLEILCKGGAINGTKDEK